MQSREALAPLAHLANDPEWTVRFAAVEALGKLDASQVIHVLLGSLKDPDAHVRSAAICAVARTCRPEAFAPLLDMLNDPREEVRDACLRCVPIMAASIPRETVLGLLRHERSWERALAVRIVDEGRILMETPSETASYYAAAQQWHRLETMGPDGSEALRAALDVQDPEIRLEAVTTLGRMRSADILNHLYYALNDSDAGVKTAACKGLRNITGLDLKSVDE